MRVSSVRISTRSFRSRLVSGSSMRNARGSRTSARARATRCISPPDSWAGLRSSSRSMWSSSATRPTARRISSAGSRRARSGEAMFSGDGLLRVERVALEDHRQVARRRRGAGGVEAVEVDAARVELLEPRDGPQRRRLPSAGGPEHDEERAVGHVERRPRRAPAPRRTPCGAPPRGSRPSGEHRLGVGVVDRRRSARVAHAHRSAGGEAASRAASGRGDRFPSASTT